MPELDPSRRREIAEALSRLLADTYTLYVKTHNYHWNVTGPMFTTLHTLFEQEYTELALAVDEIAERIRALGQRAPGSFAEFGALARVKEDTEAPEAHQMLRRLAEDQQTVVNSAQEVFRVAEKANDQPSVDLAVQRMRVHEKNAWMLQSHLE